ncbi:MAG TPA: helix-turn-helix domain-containing protein [Gammaproteobacteria bacterium]|nr:helix-turn-helix domain-containing protein [Gammaproteobacteria bacterium]
MQSSEPIGPAKDAAEPAENLGVRLRRAREAQGLSIDAVSTELRISVPALTALEECRFEALGPPVFARGYLRQYGARLGLDVAGLIAGYERLAGDTSVEIAPSRTIRLRNERQVVFLVGAGLALLLAAAILATWWWLGRSAVTDAAGESGAPRAAAAASEFAAAPGSASASASASAPASDPQPTADIERAPVARSAPQPPPEAAPETDALPSQAARIDPVGETVEPYAGPTLEIVFVEDSWTEITDADGERLYYALGLAGTSSSIPADRDLNLFFGNAAGVELRLDGEPFAIPVSARRGDLAQFNIEARTGQAP